MHIAIAILFVWFMPIVAYAQGQGGLVPCGPTSPNPAAGYSNEPCTIGDIFNLLINIFNFLLGMGAIVAFMFLIYGGIRMFLYSVDEAHLAEGKKTVIEALIGLAIIALAYVLVNTLLTVLGLTNTTQYFDGTYVK